MQRIIRTDLTIGEICDGFRYDENEDKGLYGMGGRLIIQPEYQRNYFYSVKQAIDVMESVLGEYDIGNFHFIHNPDDTYEVLDGQQRLTSIGRYVTNSYSFLVPWKGKECDFNDLSQEERDKILDTKLIVNIYDNIDPTEINRVFSRSNISGVPLEKQELRNASYYGPFVSKARTIFSNVNYKEMPVWRTYIKGNPKRQEIFETALKWISEEQGITIEEYMKEHRQDDNVDELLKYLNSVIDWVANTFDYTGKLLCGVDWGRLYREYHNKPYPHDKLNNRVSELMQDPFITKQQGIFEYVLGKEKNPTLLNIRFFPPNIQHIVYQQQTEKAQKKGISNCPLCAVSEGPNANKKYKESDMEADHITPWINGGNTDISNCQMLCKTHNRAKYNL